MTLLAIVILMAMVVLAHELGHFSMAKCLGIEVKCLSIGMGPKVYSWPGRSTEYRISALPLGGYVQFTGMEPGESRCSKRQLLKHGKALSFCPFWKKALVLLAGPLANLVLAWVIATILFMTPPGIQLPVVGEDNSTMPVQNSFLVPGDSIQTINGKTIRRWRGVERALEAVHDEGALTLLDFMVTRKTIDYDGARIKERQVEVKSVPLTAISGISSALVYGQLSLSDAALESVTETMQITKDILFFIGGLISGERSFKDIGGPVYLAAQAGQYASEGLRPLLGLSAFLSINLFLFNLLPLPILDGGQLLLALFESLAGRSVSKPITQLISFLGVMLLMAFILVISYNDIRELYEQRRNSASITYQGSP